MARLGLVIALLLASASAPAHRLGEIYQKGLGNVPADPPASQRWFNAARNLGYPPPVGDFPNPPRR